MTPREAERMRAHAVELGLSASVEEAEFEETIIRVWLTTGAVLTLSMDRMAVGYLLAHLAEIAE